MNETNSVAIFSKAALMLAEADTIQKAKELKDLALTATDFARRKGMGEEAIQHCTQYARRAELRMGELLAQTERAKGTAGTLKGKNASGGPVLLPPEKSQPTLAELGVTKRDSADAQAISGVSMDERESYVVGGVSKANIKKKLRQAENERKERAAAAAAPKIRPWVVTDSPDLVPCAAVITDPPYGILDEPWEPKKLESFTRKWLGAWNLCGADFILSFWSQRHLFTGREWFDSELTKYKFQQLLVWHYANNKSPQSREGFKQTWEPIFFYRRKDSTKQISVGGSEWGKGLTDFDCHVAAVPQSNFNGADRKQHPAQKPVSVMRWLINTTTARNETVADPFCGSGTTGIATVQLGRIFHGIESDEKFIKLALRRIAAYGKI